MKLSEKLQQHHDCGDFGNALEGLPEETSDLERQLAESKAEIQRLTELSKASGILAIMEQLEEAQRQLAEARKEINIIQQQYNNLAGHHNQHCTCGDIY